MNIKSIYMKKFIFSVLICGLAFSILSAAPQAMAKSIENQGKKVIGYYTSWSAYSGFTPDKVDATKLTHINYGFANISEDLKVILGDSYIDPSNIKKLNELKKTNPKLKILISIGGWTWSDKFSDVALTDKSRNNFANNCVDFIKKYGFDGIDLDWEYPVAGGISTNKSRKEDKQNFTLLLKTIREKLNVQGKKDGKHYVLSIAGGAGNMYIENVELWNIHKYIDFANIMTYDMHGVWDKYTDFNAPLYINNSSPNYVKWSIDSAVKSWINAGFPKEKIVMGVPFFGKQYNMVNLSANGLYQTYKGGSSISYADIVSKYLNKPGVIKYYHSESMVPWLYDGINFISYENEESIEHKGEYIKSKGLGGVMIWELSNDPNKILLDKLNKKLK
ncbi:glycoside hydrolase family 18 protein [Tissierella praeacuta]|uniref:glycoside hydrolase family 18 protein n=2 Tax=Tissierella praeacuta TaxID=43131 RepID=UPI000EE58152|nr:glycoside hydrolase family 18 protein [Tissierella praeacuta]MBU5257200.1 glycoside hydrolase family 18 protein [Tissierella praeacuta]HAE91599.1 hypothetical protein [Tissierella sp.]